MFKLPDWDLDELELGERVADWQFAYSAGNVYSDMEDRWWFEVLNNYRSVVLVTGVPVPDGWYPDINSEGRWVHSIP